MSYSYWLLFVLTFLSAGCTNITVYKNPLTELSASATRTRVAVETLSQEANRAKVKNIALTAAIESQRFGTNDLTELIPQEFVKVRAYGLELIERLATRLLQVIDSKEGETVTAAVENVGEKAKTLAERLGNTSVASYAGPVSSLAATVINIYDQRKREQILLKGVKDGIPQAQLIIDTLKKDFTPQSATNIQTALLEELEQQVTEQIHRYDLLLQNQINLSDSEKKDAQRIAARFEAIERIIVAQEAVNALKSQTVLQTLENLSAALEGLKQVVTSNKDVTSFSVFVAQVVTFSQTSVELLEAVRVVKDARESTAK